MGILTSAFIEINEEKAFAPMTINEIQIDLKTIPVRVKTTVRGSDIKFRLFGKAMQDVTLSTKVEADALHVKVVRKRLRPEVLHLEISLPEDYQKDFALDITTGSVKIDDLTLNRFTLSSTTGSIQANALTGREININTTTGGIKTDRVNAEKLTLAAKTGAIQIQECMAKTTKIETTVGNITLNNTSGKLDLKAKTGKVALCCDPLDQDINIETTTGSICLKLPATAKFWLDASTTTGNIKTEFTNHTNDSRKVTLKTSTGSISVLKK